MSMSNPCPQCGARPTEVTGATCTYCGAVLPAESRGAFSEADDAAARVGALRSSEGFDEAMAHVPDVGSQAAQGCAVVGCVTVFAVVTGLISLGATGITGFAFLEGGLFGMVGLPFVIVPGIMSLVAGLAALGAYRQVNAFHSSPVERRPVLVQARRTVGGGDGAASEYATLLFEDGARSEWPIFPGAVGRVLEGEVGIAYTRGEHLIDFQALRVKG